MRYAEFKKHYVVTGKRIVNEYTSSINDSIDDLPKTSDEFDKMMDSDDVNFTLYTVIDPMFRIVKSRLGDYKLDGLTYVDLVDEIAAFPDDDFEFTITEESTGNNNDGDEEDFDDGDEDEYDDDEDDDDEDDE